MARGHVGRVKILNSKLCIHSAIEEYVRNVCRSRVPLTVPSAGISNAIYRDTRQLYWSVRRELEASSRSTDGSKKTQD